MFLFHYRKHQQISGNRGLRTSTLTINILKRGPITYYPINFDQHKKFYDFFSNGIADAFLESVYEIYRPSKENKFQGYAEIINQQRREIILAGMVDYVRGEIRDGITKRIIASPVVVGTSKDLIV